MSSDFLHTVLGRTRFPVYRLGLSASYRPGAETVRHAVEEGVNFFFAYGVDQQMIRGLREVTGKRRESIILATGAYNFIWGYPNLRRTLEERLRQFATDYIDLFLFMGVMKPKQFPPRALEEMVRFRDEGKVRSIGLSTHDRAFAGQLAVRDAVGKPIAGARIQIDQQSHEFLFGCNFFGFERVGDAEREQQYRERFAALLNFATLPFYWAMYEPESIQILYFDLKT